jgi:hypothetical protein
MKESYSMGNLKVPMYLAAVLCILLSGCGGGSSGGVQQQQQALTPVPGDSSSYAPYNSGNSWAYRVTRNEINTPTVDVVDFIKVTQANVVNGAVQAVLTESDNSGNRSSQPILKNNSGLFYSDSGYPVLKFPLMINDHFLQMNVVGQDYGEDLDRDGVNEHIDAHSEITVVGVETVTVNAGTFENCVRVQTDGRQTMHFSSDSSTRSVAITTSEWYAPGMGLVKRTTSVTSGGYVVASESYNLTSYLVDGRKSESTTPTVTSVDQTGVVPASAASAIAVHFSEEMDPLSLNSGTFTLSNSGGQSITGTISYSKASAMFIPATPLPSGTYTATVSTGAHDPSGNALAQNYSWIFTVDATAPLVVSTYPLAGATSVPVTSAITANFSEPINMWSLDSYSFVVRGPDQTAVWGDVGQINNNTTWTFTPRNALEHGTTYTATITGAVRDTAGNYIPAGYSWSFTTPPAVFDRYLGVPTGAEAEAVAIGDVTGDGKNDVVVVTGPYSGNSSIDNKLLVYPQTATGALGSPLKYSTSGTYTTRLSSIAIGDLNHDGKSDVVVTNLSSGFEVFLQDSSGGLAAAVDYPTPCSWQVRVADVNEDGRDDVIALGNGNVAVYLQDASGKLVLSATYPATNDAYSDLAVGDVNHDGHLDIIFSGVGVLTGRGDGTFNAAVTYPAAGSLAVGDVNGDGLNDIVAGSVGILYQTDSYLMGPLTQRSLGQSVRIADIDNDGRQDVIVQHGGWGHIGIFFQHADGTLGEEDSYVSSYGSYEPGTLAAGDINGDGFKDIVAVDQSGLAIHYNRGQGVSVKQSARRAKTVSQSLPGTIRTLWRRIRK